MAKKPNLSDLSSSIAHAAGSTRAARIEAIPPGSAPKRPVALSRKNTEPITGHFPRDVRKMLKDIALQHDKTLQNLLAEAFNDLFLKYGKPEIAPITARHRKSDIADDATDQTAAEQG